MQITIDGSKIDFTLENEKTMADVVQGIEKWLASSNSIMTGITLDGEVFDPSDRNQLENKSPNDVQGLDVTTSPVENIEVENAIDVLSYLKRYLELMENRDQQIVSDDAFEGLHWVLTSVRLAAALNMINLLAFPDSGNSLFNLFVRLEAALLKLRGMDISSRLNAFFNESDSVVRDLFPAVKSFYELIADRKDRDFDPLERADRCAEDIRNLLSRIGDLSTDLQTGNELKAMQAIQETTLRLENLFTFVSVAETKHAVDTADVLFQDETLKDWIKRLSTIGSEIIEAFNNQDTVLLGDLFEYEIGEQLEKASGFIDVLKTMLGQENAG